MDVSVAGRCVSVFSDSFATADPATGEKRDQAYHRVWIVQGDGFEPDQLSCNAEQAEAIYALGFGAMINCRVRVGAFANERTGRAKLQQKLVEWSAVDASAKPVKAA